MINEYMSYHSVESINDYIDSELCSVNYSTFDDASQVISAKSEKALTAKWISRMYLVCYQYVLKIYAYYVLKIQIYTT